MQNNDDDNNAQFGAHEEDAYSLVKRYEAMLRENKRVYFDIEEFEVIIDHYIWMDNPVAANKATDIADSFYPDSTDLKIRRAEIFILENESYSALKLLDQLEQLEPNNAFINLVKGKANIEIGNTREISRQFELAISKDPDNALDMLMQIADYLTNIGNFNLALKYLKRAADKAPCDFDVLYQVAYCYDRLNDLENSIVFYEKCLDENPFDEGVWHNLGIIYSRKNEHDKAVVAFDYALTINSGYEPALYNKANTLANLERYSESIEAFTEFLQLEPNNLYAQCTIGECYGKMGEYAKATDTYTKVIEADRNFSDAYYGLSIVMLQQELYEESALYITQALEIDPENPDFWFASGELLLKVEQKTEALIAFQRTVEYNPYDTDAWIYIAELVSEKSVEEAILALKKAYVYNYDTPQISYRLAALFFTLQDTQNCISFLEKGLTLNAAVASDFFTLCPEASNNVDIMTLYQQFKQI